MSKKPLRNRLDVQEGPGFVKIYTDKGYSLLPIIMTLVFAGIFGWLFNTVYSQTFQTYQIIGFPVRKIMAEIFFFALIAGFIFCILVLLNSIRERQYILFSPTKINVIKKRFLFSKKQEIALKDIHKVIIQFDVIMVYLKSKKYKHFLDYGNEIELVWTTKRLKSWVLEHEGRMV